MRREGLPSTKSPTISSTFCHLKTGPTSSQPFSQYPNAYETWNAAGGTGNYGSVDLDAKDGFEKQSSIGRVSPGSLSCGWLSRQLTDGRAELGLRLFLSTPRIRRSSSSCIKSIPAPPSAWRTPSGLFSPDHHLPHRPLRHQAHPSTARSHEALRTTARVPRRTQETTLVVADGCLAGRVGGTWDAESISDISSRNSFGRRDNFRIPQRCRWAVISLRMSWRRWSIHSTR